ncbi:MAG: DUF421 domain-containing protein, partial [Gemmatimonadota bacterium]|nr:DUF421 domain-containing protein [Gemmatimonadota bacterium]
THPTVARWLEGDADVLIENGKLHDARMKRELITHGELEAAARRQGIEGLDQVETCRLEVGGALTFVPRAPTDDERRHRELIETIAALRKGQSELLSRLEDQVRRA